jgi:hypothetical protein
VTRGVGVKVRCSSACSFTVKLTITAGTARKYGLDRKALTLGRGKSTVKFVRVTLRRRASDHAPRPRPTTILSPR